MTIEDHVACMGMGSDHEKSTLPTLTQNSQCAVHGSTEGHRQCRVEGLNELVHPCLTRNPNLSDDSATSCRALSHNSLAHSAHSFHPPVSHIDLTRYRCPP
jgi:hypothetical protein